MTQQDIDTLTRSELENEIKRQIALTELLRNRLEKIIAEQKKHDVWLRQRKEYSKLQKAHKIADDIEKKIYTYMQRHWKNFSFLFIGDPKPLTSENINSKDAIPTLARQIIVYLIDERKIMIRSEIARRMNLKSLYHSIKVINDYMFDVRFRVEMDKLKLRI